MSEQSLARPGVFCCDRMFLCRDRVGNGGEALCRDIIFYVMTEYGQMERFCVVTRNFLLRHSYPVLEDFLSRLSIFMSRQSWPRQGEIMSRQSNSML